VAAASAAASILINRLPMAEPWAALCDAPSRVVSQAMRAAGDFAGESVYATALIYVERQQSGQ